MYLKKNVYRIKNVSIWLNYILYKIPLVCGRARFCPFGCMVIVWFVCQRLYSKSLAHSTVRFIEHVSFVRSEHMSLKASNTATLASSHPNLVRHTLTFTQPLNRAETISMLFKWNNISILTYNFYVINVLQLICSFLLHV